MFGVLAAGKSSSVQAKKLNDFLSTPMPTKDQVLDPSAEPSPFGWLSALKAEDLIGPMARRHKLGKYTRVVLPCFRSLAEKPVDVMDTGLEELKAIPGVGPKTAEFFLLHTDEGFCGAALDTHILDWLGGQGYEVPDASPQGEQDYARLRRACREEARKRGMTTAELDSIIWKSKSKS